MCRLSFSGADQTKYSLDTFASNLQHITLTEAFAVCVVLYLWARFTLLSLGFGISDERSLLTFYFSNRLNTEKHTQTNWDQHISPPLCRKGGICPCPLCVFGLVHLVWHFLIFLRFAIQLFSFLAYCVRLQFFFCRDSPFLYLIKIWKLNFHSIFSNHLIKISSTTTKKIALVVSKRVRYPK